MASKPYKKSGSDSTYWYIDYNNADGRRVRECTYETDLVLAKGILHNRKEAVLRAKERKERGIPGIQDIELADAFAAYVELQRPHWSPAWLYQAQHNFKKWIMPALGGADALVSEVTRVMVETMRAEMDAQVSGATINRVSAVGSKFFKWCMHPDRHYAAANPFSDHTHYGEEGVVPPPLSRAQLDAWLACIERLDLQRAAIVSLDTGLRLGEIRRIHRSDLIEGVDAGVPLLHVVSSYKRATKLTRGTTKNKRERFIPLTPRAASAIHAQLTGANPKADDRPFASIPAQPALQMKKAFLKSGIPAFRWHDQRHYALTAWADEGLQAHDLQALAGWTTGAMAARYIHGSAKAASAILASKLGAIGPISGAVRGPNGHELSQNSGYNGASRAGQPKCNSLDLQ